MPDLTPEGPHDLEWPRVADETAPLSRLAPRKGTFSSCKNHQHQVPTCLWGTSLTGGNTWGRGGEGADQVRCIAVHTVHSKSGPGGPRISRDLLWSAGQRPSTGPHPKWRRELPAVLKCIKRPASGKGEPSLPASGSDEGPPLPRRDGGQFNRSRKDIAHLQPRSRGLCAELAREPCWIHDIQAAVLHAVSRGPGPATHPTHRQTPTEPRGPPAGSPPRTFRRLAPGLGILTC